MRECELPEYICAVMFLKLGKQNAEIDNPIIPFYRSQLVKSTLNKFVYIIF